MTTRQKPNPVTFIEVLHEALRDGRATTALEISRAYNSRTLHYFRLYNDDDFSASAPIPLTHHPFSIMLDELAARHILQVYGIDIDGMTRYTWGDKKPAHI